MVLGRGEWIAWDLNQNPRLPETLVNFSRRQCLDVSQLLNHLAQDGECQRFLYVMGILLRLYQVAQM